jgi:hypothetical protein
MIAPAFHLYSENTSNFQDDIFGEVHPHFTGEFTPMTLGAFNSHGIFAMTSTASAPPTPIAGL